MHQRQHQEHQWQEQEQAYRQRQQGGENVPQKYVPPEPATESDEEKRRRQVREDEETGKQRT